jgi:hypothetical protein
VLRHLPRRHSKSSSAENPATFGLGMTSMSERATGNDALLDGLGGGAARPARFAGHAVKKQAACASSTQHFDRDTLA